jgi:hypothetical protein
MSDDDFLAEMAKDKGDARETKQTIKHITGKSKQPGPPADQKPPYGKDKGGKGK